MSNGNENGNLLDDIESDDFTGDVDAAENGGDLDTDGGSSLQNNKTGGVGSLLDENVSLNKPEPQKVETPKPATEAMTPAQAAEEIGKILEACRKDPMHDYVSMHDLKAHRLAVEKMMKLHEIAAGNKTDPIEAAMSTALEEQKQKQNALVEAAKIEMRRLVELGYSNDKIPADIREDQLRLLSIQRKYAEGDSTAIPALIKEAEALKDYNAVELLRNFKPSAIFDTDIVNDILDKIIFKINDLNNRKYGKRSVKK